MLLSPERGAGRREIAEALQAALRPELLNRIQHIVYFDPLDEGAVRCIIDKIVAGVEARLRERRIRLALS